VRLIFLLVVWLSACSSPTSPEDRRYSLVGAVRDPSSQPIAGARIEITNGPFTGRFAISDATGEFHFVDPAFVSEPVTLHIFKEGYRPAFALTEQLRTIVTLAPNATEGTITFKAADDCTLPPSLMSRTYTATLDIWEPGSRTLVIPLTGADFFSGLRTVWANVGRGRPVAEFRVSSYEVLQRFLDEVPIYERIGASGYLSFFGTATTSAPPPQDSFATSFDGTISYCANATDPGGGSPPQCLVAEVHCRSNGHELTGTRR
jgi:hypothetical protein